MWGHLTSRQGAAPLGTLLYSPSPTKGKGVCGDTPLPAKGLRPLEPCFVSTDHLILLAIGSQFCQGSGWLGSHCLVLGLKEVGTSSSRLVSVGMILCR